MEALVLCDQACLSRSRLVRSLEEVMTQAPNFHFRFVEAGESLLLMNSLKIQYLPATILAEQIFYGVPDQASLLALIQRAPT